MFDLKKIFLDLLFPIECLGCGRNNNWLCSSCFSKFKQEQISIFNISGEEGDVSVGYIAKYENEWEKIIVNFKYQFVAELSDLINKAIKPAFRSQISKEFFSQNWVLVPIPLSKKRQAWRGFNQAEIIAQLVGNYTELKVEKDLLFRPINTRPQVGLSQKQRKTNLKDAFLAKPKLNIEGVILVDDVVTTGSTINECAKALRLAGIKKIKAFVLAKG